MPSAERTSPLLLCLQGLAVWAILLFAGSVRAQDNSHGFHRDSSGRQWVVVSDQAASFSLRRFDAGGAVLGEVSLSSAADNADFTIASAPGGDAWVSGGVSDGGPAGFGVWHVSADGLSLISSAAFFGQYDIAAGGIAVDASSRVWVTAPEGMNADFTAARFALWRFEQDGSLSAGFPKRQQRENGVLDGGLSIAVDSSGDVWSAGVSLMPGATVYDLALWRYAPDGSPRLGFPVYRGSAYATLDEIEPGILIAAGDKVWVTASQLFPGCADRQHALFRFDTSGNIELQRYWHNAAENASNGRNIALASDGSPWVLGRSSNTTAVWAYDRYGSLEPGFPRTDPDLNSGGIALDAGDVPWVVYGSAPGAFVGAQAVAGVEGLPSCALLSSGTIAGSVVVEGGAPAGSSVTVVASPDGFQMEMFAATFVSTGGASVPFTIELQTAGDYAVGAFIGDNPDAIDVSTPIGFYRDFTPVSLAPGGSASGVDFTIALDTVAPVVAVAFPVAGSTVAALPVVEGSGYDANGVGDVQLAVQDLDADLWYDPNVPGWSPSASPAYRSVNADLMGPANAVEWSVAISSVDNGNFGRLDERLVQGHHYRVLAFSGDFVGHESNAAETTFTWDGPTGSVGPQAPSAVIGQALGVSSIAWSWNAAQGATAYFLASSSYTAPFASVSTTSYISEGLLPAETRMLCVAGVNLLIAGDYSCSTAETLPAVPGAVAAAEVFETSVTWSWTDGGNSANASYELSLSTDGFAAHVSTPLPVGFYHRGSTYTAEGLTPNTVYSARVRAYNLGLTLSDFSPAGSTRTSTGALQAPYNVTALFNRAEAKVSLSWTAPDPAPASYRVYRGTEVGNLALLGGTTDTAFADFPVASAFYFYAVASVGELGGESQLSGLQSVRFDVTPPSVSFVQPAVGETLSRPYTVIVNASDDFTSASVRFDVDGIARATTTVSHQFFWDVRDETDGPHTLAAVATDDDGNQTSISRSVVVAYSTPVPPTIIVPSDNFSTLATTFTVQGYAPLLTGVRVYADAVLLGTSAVDAVGQWSLPEAAFPGQGDYLLTAVAFEARGESYASAALRVAYFAQPPAAPGAVSAAVDRQTGLVELTWGASAGTTPALDYRVERATAADGEYAVLASTPTTAYRDFPGASGDYHYRVRAAHGSGLLSAFVATSALLDITPPAAISDLHITDYRPVGAELELAWTAAVDDMSGVAHYLLYSSTSAQVADAAPQTIAAPATAFTVSVATTEVRFFALRAVDGAGNESALSNTAVFDLLAPAINSVDLAPGQVLSRPRVVTVAAADDGSQPSVIFSVDGVALSTVAAPPYSFYFDVSAYADGAHALGVRAVDANGNASETSRAVIVNYFPPPVPVITSPAQDARTASPVMTVSGTGEQGITIEVFINGAFAGSATVSGPFGSFTAPDLFLPAEGAISITAAAKDSRGSSPATTPVNVVLDFGPPGIPQLPTAQSLSAGRIRLTWLPPSGEVPAFYRVYRSANETEMVAGSTVSASLQIASVADAEHVDGAPTDGLYFYGVTAVDAASNEGLLSEIAPAVADAVAPSASVALTQSVPPLPPGLHPIELTLSEALATPPILTFTPQGRTPAVIGLTGVTATLWQGTVTINASINSDYGTFAFQGSDFLGNVGTAIVSGGTVTLNARGPVGTVTVSSALASAGTQVMTLSLDEPAATTPTLSVTPFGKTAVPVVLSGSNHLWTGSLTIDAATGDGPVYIGFSAADSVGNIGTSLSGGATTFVIDTTPPAAPLSLAAVARPGGSVDLAWNAPSGERPASYFVYRDGVKLAAPVAPLTNGNGSFTDVPSEGAHDYAVTAVDAAANEGPASNTVNSSADQTPPPAPLEFAAAAQTQSGSDGIALTWTPGAGETAAVVRVYRSTEPITGLAGLPFQAVAASPYFEVPSEDAHYYFAATALDAAGNESGASNQADLSFLNAAPRIAVTGVQNGAYYNHDVNPAFSASDLNLDAVTAQLDGVPFASGAPVSAEGLHTLTVAAADLGAHASSATVVFTIDKVAPLISLSGVAEGALLHSSASITIAVTDLSPVTTAHILTNNAVPAAYASGDVIDDDGSFVLVASATDRAGNTATRSLAFTMDTAPRLPLNLAARLEDGVGADLSWASPAADVLAYRVYKDGARVSASLHTPTTFRDTSCTSAAQHIYEVTAVDQLGQEGPRAKITIPPVGLTLAGYGLVVSGQEALTRGFSDTLRLGLANRDTQTRVLGPAALELSAGGQVYATAQAAAVSVGAGGSGESSGVAAVSAALPASASLKASLTLPTEAGTSAVLVKSFTLAVREPASPVVEVFTGALIRGALTQVRVKLNNRGSAPFEVRTAVVEGFSPSPANEVSASLNTLEGTLLSQAGLVQTTGTGISARVEGGKLTYFATVDAGTSFLFDPVEVAVPESAGDSLKVSGRVKTFTGTQSQAAVAAPAYTATVAAAQPVYDQGSQVTLSGETRDQAQALLGGATVQIRIVSKGYTRTLTTVTAPSGAYSVVFNPLPNEAGVYSLSASAPEAISNAAQSSFTIVGFGFSPTTLTARLNQNSSLALNVNLTNTGESSVTGLTLQLEGVPAGLNLVLGGAPSTLLAGVQGPLSLRVEASPTAAIGQAIPVLVARDSNGFERRLPITVEVTGSQPIPRVTPQAFQVGMLAGEVRRQVILLENIGFSAWENVTLSSPTLPWVKITGTGNMGSIPPGGNASFGISFEPPADLPTGQFVQNPLVEVRSGNSAMIPVNVGVTITSSKQGNLAFTVINADKPKDALGKGVPVPGADVTLTNLDIAGLTYNGKADANGVVSFTAIPSGSYNWRAQATGFGPSSGVESVESGLTKEVLALMVTTMVTYEWGVTESTIKDRYDLTLDVTFKTDVLAPALVVEPKLIPVPLEGGQSMLTQYTITNKGLVSAFNVDLRPAMNDDAVILELPFTSIPELKPGQSVVVPVKVSLVHASCHPTRIVHRAGYICSFGSEAPCIIEDVVFMVGQMKECFDGGPLASVTAQTVSYITGSPAPKPCTCSTHISGGDANSVDFIRLGETKSYSVKVKQSESNCPCKLVCEKGTTWSSGGDLIFVGGTTGCNVSVTSPEGHGGTLTVEKGGLVACKNDSRRIAGCDISAINVPAPDYRTTFVGGDPIAITVSASPDDRCPLDLEAVLTKNIGGLSISGKTVTFTPGTVADTATLTIRDKLKPSVFSTATIIVNDPPTVTISSVLPRPVTCAGKPITIKAVGLPALPAGEGIYEWIEDVSVRPETGDTLIVNSNSIANDKRISVTYKANGQKSTSASTFISFAKVATLGFIPFQDSFSPTYFVEDDLTITATATNTNLPGSEIAIAIAPDIPHTPGPETTPDGKRIKSIHLTGTVTMGNIKATCGDADVGIFVDINVNPR